MKWITLLRELIEDIKDIISILRSNVKLEDFIEY